MRTSHIVSELAQVGSEALPPSMGAEGFLCLLLPPEVRRGSIREAEDREMQAPASEPGVLSPSPPIRSPSPAPPPHTPLLLRPLTSRSQRDRRRSRQARALGGPGRRWGGTQRGTHSHQGPGGGCWPSQRPSRGPRRPGGGGPDPNSSGQGPSPTVCAGRRGALCWAARSDTQAADAFIFSLACMVRRHR